jgi:glycosyltransferase involved in cell wall biosynthesis
MRVLHVPYSFFPDPAGGTEVYVEGLAACQRSFGYDAAVAAPGDGPARYEQRGIPVWRFPVSSGLDLRDMYGLGDKKAAEAFARILDEFAPDIVHLHAFTSAVSVRLAEKAAERRIPIVMNYHTPTVSCSRGTLLKWGAEICDGHLDQRVCTSCALHANGLPRPLAALIAAMPTPLSRNFGRAGLSGGPWTALRMPELIELRIAAFHQLMQMADRVIALCNWTRDLLIRNNVPESRIMVCRQGIDWSADVPASKSPRPLQLPLRAAFLGRLDPTKGVHVVVGALKSDPAMPVKLDVFGIHQGGPGNRYVSDLEGTVAGDSRIRLLPAIPSGDVVECLRRYDVLIVPSQWMETGPLVVLEAFAAGIPVVASDLGGIAELVADGVDGLLVRPHASPAAWAGTLRRVCSEAGLFHALQAGIRTPRRSKQAAIEMMPLYESLAGKPCAKPSYA